jgi:nucleoid DNA-binding protein
MTKSDLAVRLAKQTRSSKAEAADQLDRVVHEIIFNLRKGQPARFPGLGSFSPGEKWRFQFDAEAPTGGKRAGK